MKSEICYTPMDREILVGKQFFIDLACFCMFCMHSQLIFFLEYLFKDVCIINSLGRHRYSVSVLCKGKVCLLSSAIKIICQSLAKASQTYCSVKVCAS